MTRNKGLNELEFISVYGLTVGLKDSGRPDLAFIYSDVPLTTVAMFTSNRVKAAPVIHARRILPSDNVRLFIINSGTANALTGADGLEDIKSIVHFFATEMGLSKKSIIMSSTGVIGRRLDIGKICKGYDEMRKIKPSSLSAAEAIMTTDTVPKLGYRKVMIGNKTIEIAYMAKGAGMIAPDLATMLVFIGTNVNLAVEALQRDLNWAVDRTLNHITVDGDMSTNDSVFLFTTRKSAVLNEQERVIWRELLQEICYEIAEKIVRDGEGATKFVRINVLNAQSQAGAKKVALAVANSLLVKTALFGEDPNVGRIAAAVGATGVRFDVKKLDVFINGVEVIKNGSPICRLPRRLLKPKDIKIDIYLNNGKCRDFVLTTDLSYDYVKINAEYHT